MAWLHTLSGKAFDLHRVDPRLVDFENDIAPALAKLSRFVGHTFGDDGYSVAQHCVLGAESLYAKTSSPRLAALFVLHDAHEAYIGDVATPTAVQLDEDTNYAFAPYLKRLKARLDYAIFSRAGVHMPDDAEVAAIKYHDVAMMNAERAVLKGSAPETWGAAYDAVPPAAVQTIELLPWDASTAREEWLGAFTRFVVHGGSLH